MPRAAERYCVFCEIIAGREAATVLHEDDDFIVFRNKLKWVPVMLLVVPKDHMTQAELWSDMKHAGEIASKLGKEHCPNGFRVLSNFGYDAMQSQEHGHLHVIGGLFLGPYA